MLGHLPRLVEKKIFKNRTLYPDAKDQELTTSKTERNFYYKRERSIDRVDEDNTRAMSAAENEADPDMSTLGEGKTTDGVTTLHVC